MRVRGGATTDHPSAITSFRRTGLRGLCLDGLSPTSGEKFYFPCDPIGCFEFSVQYQCSQGRVQHCRAEIHSPLTASLSDHQRRFILLRKVWRRPQKFAAGSTGKNVPLPSSCGSNRSFRIESANVI